MLIGRVWLPSVDGPAPVTVRGDDLLDLSGIAPTCSQLLELDNVPDAIRRAASLPRIGSLSEVLANSTASARNAGAPWLLASTFLSRRL